MEASPVGDVVAVGSCDHCDHDVQLWNVKSGTLVRRFALTPECVESLSFSPDGTLLATGAYSCCSGQGVQVWDVRSGNLVRDLPAGLAVRHVVFGGDGRWVAAVSDRGTASVFDWPSGRLLHTFGGLAMAGYLGPAVIASRDGRYLAWLRGDPRVWDLESGAEVPLPDMASEGQPVAEFLNDGRLAYANGGQMVVMRLPVGPAQVVPLAKLESLRIHRVGRCRIGTAGLG